MNCRMVRDNIKAYIDGELGLLARYRMARHLAACDECRMEAKIMTDLTNEVGNIHGVPAPEELRQKVLGKLEFEPESTTPRSAWSFATSTPMGIFATLAIIVVMAAVLFPVFSKARKSSTKSTQLMEARQRAMARYEPNSIPQASAPGAAPIAFKPIAAKAELAKALEGRDLKTVTNRLAAHPAPSEAVLLIIKTADLTVEVRSFDTANDEAISIAKSSGGYVTDSSASTDGSAPTSGNMTLRVPVESFEHAVERLGKLGKVKSKRISGQDVSGEVVDLESRLRNKRAEERQYLDIMNRAKRVNDIVTVSNELYRVRGEIEEMVGRVKYLRSASAMSTINLSLAEKGKPKPAPQSSIRRSFTDAIASLGDTLSSLASFIIWLAVYSPFWALPIVILLYWRKRSTPVPPRTEPS